MHKSNPSLQIQLLTLTETVNKHKNKLPIGPILQRQRNGSLTLIITGQQ